MLASVLPLDDKIIEMRGIAASVRSGAIGLDAFVDNLCRCFSGPRLFYIILEHITAARTDGDLRDVLLLVVKRFHVALDDMWTEFFEARGTADHRAQSDALPPARGRVCPDGAETRRTWKTILVTLMEGRGSGGTLTESVGV